MHLYSALSPSDRFLTFQAVINLSIQPYPTLTPTPSMRNHLSAGFLTMFWLRVHTRLHKWAWTGFKRGILMKPVIFANTADFHHSKHQRVQAGQRDEGRWVVGKREWVDVNIAEPVGEWASYVRWWMSVSWLKINVLFELFMKHKCKTFTHFCF